MVVTIPTFDEVARRLNRGSPRTALDRFVFNHEPSVRSDIAEWRLELADAIAEIIHAHR